jgi:hypothetical protein
MTLSPNLALPYLDAAQAQKHVTHNEALRLLDALVMLAVADRDLAAAPATPADGARYIVAAGATGAWSGQAGKIAAWQDGAWTFIAPRAGYLAYVADETVLVVFDGAAWQAAGGGAPSALDNLTRLGVGTAADATNAFAAKLNNALWTARGRGEGGDGTLRYKMNKETAAATLSLLMQTAYSGRAEIGLTGDDDLHCKVSPDGAAWYEAMRVNRANGQVSFPAGIAGAVSDFDYLVNGDGQVNQANAGAGIADGAYGHDQWVALTQSGAIAVATLADQEDGLPSMICLTQSQASAQRFGYLQPLEASRVKRLRGKAVTLVMRLASSTGTAIRYALVEHTGTADALTRDIVNDWTSSSYATGNFFAAQSGNITVRAVGSMTPAANARTDATLAATLGSSFNNLYVFIWTESAQAQNATLAIAANLRRGAAAAPVIMRPYADELRLCQRYWEQSHTGDRTARNGACGNFFGFPGGLPNGYASYPRFVVTKRNDSSIVTVYATQSGTSGKIRDVGGGADRDASVDLINRHSFRALSFGSFVDTTEFHFEANNRL